MNWIIGTHWTCFIVGMIVGAIMMNRAWRKRVGKFTKEIEADLERLREQLKN